jgi:hypothetical protein
VIRRLFRRARPRTGAGTAPARLVTLPVHDVLAPALDALAEVYAADPATVGAVLRRHAAAALALDLCAVDDAAAEWQRAMAAEQAAATRAALLRLAGQPARLDLLMSPDAADALAADLTRTAAEARRHPNGETA